MPIRFRCAYCNQLMGISRRKAGSVVKCPKCAGEIIVPSPEGNDSPEEPAEQPGAAGQAFEDKEFDQYFNEPANGSAAATAPAPTEAAPPPPPEAIPLPPVQLPPPQRRGVFIPVGMLVVAFIINVLLLILMFALGFGIGRQSAAPTKEAALFSPLRVAQNRQAVDAARLELASEERFVVH